MKKLKIAVDVLSIREDGSAGGATGFAIELIKGFAMTTGVQTMVLCGDWNEKVLRKLLPNNVQFCQGVGEKKFTGIGRIDRLLNRIRRKFYNNSILSKNHVDILYCPFSAATYKENGIPTVSTILDIQHEYYPQFFEPQELQHRRKFYQDIVKKVERVVCISDYTKNTFCEKYGYPEDRAQTIYIAIQNRFERADDRVLERLNIKNNQYIVYPANFWEHKNHKLLLNAFAMYAAENKEMKLVLTGNPLTQSEYYDNLLKAMKIGGRTVITGYVTNEELYSILKNAKGLIYPSLFEGFGIPIVEAMHLNKLIACSNLTSLPEIGCSAICYFDPKKPDEILRGIEFLAKNEVTDEVRKEYAEKLKEYDTDKMVNEYLKVFEDVIQNKDQLVFQEELTGIYPDGWSGAEVLLKLKDRENASLSIKLTLPEFVDFKEKVTLKYNNVPKTFVLKPGETIEIDERLTEKISELKIILSKTWSPKNTLGSGDVRQLGIMVNEINLKENDLMIDLKQELL